MNPFHSKSLAIFLGVAPFAPVGCTTEADAGANSVSIDWRATGKPTALPSSGKQSCEVTEVEFDLCEWACHADSVFVGRVISTTARFGPVSVASSQTETPYLDECPEGGQVQPALDVTVEVVDVLRGDVQLNSILTVTYPAATMSGWNPAVEADALGALVWSSSEGVPFEAETIVGINASKVTYQDVEYWSAFAEAPFSFTATWNAALAEGECSRVSDEVKEASYSQFEAMVAACPQTNYCDGVAAARAAMAPERLLAASCLLPGDRPDIEQDDP